MLAGKNPGDHFGVDYAGDVAFDAVGFEVFGEDEPEGVVGWVGGGWGESEFPGGALFDVGVGPVGEYAAGGGDWGFGEGDSSELAIAGDDDIFEKSLDHEFAGGLVVLGVEDVVDHYCYVADRDVGVDRDVEGTSADGPGAGGGEFSVADCIADASGFVEGVGPELEGEADCDCGIGADLRVGSK